MLNGVDIAAEKDTGRLFILKSLGGSVRSTYLSRAATTGEYIYSQHESSIHIVGPHRMLHTYGCDSIHDIARDMIPECMVEIG